ncbi:MAG: (2Fe-2S) ferredoxin domain-containing protein [Nitrospirae bacterium]|nr:(2Fe-2S) ferredoxin domain-containing protein [Candidatus Troglogloeales bacterium]
MPKPYHLFLCTGTTCTQQGAEDSLHRLRERLFEKSLKDVRLTLCRCLGQCGNGPNMVIYGTSNASEGNISRGGTWYGHLTEEEIDPLISQHILKGEQLAHLMREPVD